MVVLNNSTRLTRQIFTLAHEVGHLVSHTSGVTVEDHEYLRALRGESRSIEVFCNRFAAELLVPAGAFEQRTSGLDAGDGTVLSLARRYKVNREAALRKVGSTLPPSRRSGKTSTKAVHVSGPLR